MSRLPLQTVPQGFSRLCSRVFAPAHSNLTFHYIIHNHAVETTHSAPHPARSTSTPLESTVNGFSSARSRHRIAQHAGHPYQPVQYIT